MLLPVVMTVGESDELSIDDIPAWLTEHGNSPEIRGRWLSVIPKS